MCSNIYKCAIFTRSSAAHPADFTRSCLQSGDHGGSRAIHVSHNINGTAKGTATSNPCASEKSKEANQGQVNRAPRSFTTSSGKS